MILKTLDGFFITIWHLCQPSNYVHGRSTFECIPQVCQLVNISQMWFIVNDSLELVSKRLPVQDVAIKSWKCNLGRLTPSIIGILNAWGVGSFLVCPVRRDIATLNSNKFLLILGPFLNVLQSHQGTRFPSEPFKFSLKTPDFIQVIRKHMSINKVGHFDRSPNGLHWIF